MRSKLSKITFLFIIGIIIITFSSNVLAKPKTLPDVSIDSIKIVPKVGDKLKVGEKAIIKCTIRRSSKLGQDFHLSFFEESTKIKEVRVKSKAFTNDIAVFEKGFIVDDKKQIY